MKGLNLSFNFLYIMLEVKFFEPDSIANLREKLLQRSTHLKNPVLERGHVIVEDGVPEQYCDLIIKDGTKRYKVQVRITYSSDKTQAIQVYPFNVVEIKPYGGSAIGEQLEVRLSRILEDGYKKGLIEAEDYIKHLRLATNSLSDLEDEMAREYQLIENRQENMIYGTLAGAAVGTLLYFVSRNIEIPFKDIMSNVNFLMVSTLSGLILGRVYSQLNFRQKIKSKSKEDVRSVEDFCKERGLSQ